ncbi:restriction endonuclease [candidate division WOR-3 bacterium]|nr:restriction endonuclease [candidate division WOR-3 bacterium]
MENWLYCGDNIEVLEKEIEKESVDLIYIDPPFFSNRHYEVIWHDEAEIRSFEDHWKGGIEHFIAWMRPRIEAMFKVLKPTGSFYLHCDWHANAHLRIMLDEIFGANNFRNEIIWHYDIGTAPKKDLKRKHDTIFRYSKSNNYVYNEQRISPLNPARYNKKEPNGRKYFIRGDSGKKCYLDEGVSPDDVWTFVREKSLRTLNSMAKERLGYPTQKPEALLERIIKASSNEGDVVLDTFCGCGTAMVVAHQLKRKWLGIDISPTAIELVEKRLRKSGAVKDEHYKTTGLPTTENDSRKLKPFEFQNWVVAKMGASVSRKKSGDKGIDGHLTDTPWHERAGIQVKQSDKVGVGVVYNFETALRKRKYRQGYIVGFSFTRGAHEEVAELKNEGELEIKLITVQELLEKRKTLLK